jgi:hypothetical protein
LNIKIFKGMWVDISSLEEYIIKGWMLGRIKKSKEEQ